MNPFALSAPFAIDPAYALATAFPDKSGRSLWSEGKQGAFWLYAPGSLEAWLFDRTRREAFATCLNIYHPGRYRTHQPTLYVRKAFELTSVPESVPCHIYVNGSIHLSINYRTVLHQTGSACTPQRITIDLAPYLTAQTNTIRARVAADGCPPTLLIQSPCTETGPDWEISGDDLQWLAPRCFPFEGDACFPHQEELPEHVIALHKNEATGLYDAGVQVIARPVITAKGAGPVAVHPGESCAEAASTDIDAREQIIPVVPVLGAGDHSTATKLAFRYLRLAHDPAVQIESARAAVSLYPTSYKGAFACSDQRLTKIWMHAAYTLRSCMQLTFLDGLKRDRLPWVGDLYACNLGNFHSFAEQPVSEFSLAALMSPDPDEAEINGTITYSLFWVLAARDHALYFGGSPFLRGLLPYCRKLMAAVGRKMDTQGLLPTARFNWLYVDWADVKSEGYSSFLNFIYVMALDAAAQLHRELGSPDVAAKYAEEATALRNRCRAYFWDPTPMLFVDSVMDGKLNPHFGRQSNALAILAGICTKEQQNAVLANVLLNPAVAPVGTPYMKYFEVRALGFCGQHQAMATMISDYWGSMLDAGASTFWEALDSTHQGDQHHAFYGRPFGKSLCHAWSCGPLQLLSGELFGLRPLSSGWAEFTFLPASVPGMEWTCSESPTPHGPIQIQISNRHATLTFPANTVLVWQTKAGEQRYPGPGKLEFTLSADHETEASTSWKCIG
ncbi:MAG: hypothetical protein SFY80_15255 [Verrucomicrobiota bacterium]|nr:hypothetical protein [Verrucomicrobiota bacterium]